MPIKLHYTPGMEAKRILSREQPHGNSFELLGVAFAMHLIMADSVCGLAKDCRWKFKAIFRTCKYKVTDHIVFLYNAQLLPFVYATFATYHTCRTALEMLGRVQTKISLQQLAPPRRL